MTDHGLGAFAQSANQHWDAARQIMRLGDGSTAPAAGDTALDNETHETSNDGGFNRSVSHTRDSGETPEVLRMVATITRYQSFASDATVSEFGFSSASGANLSIRELFRDGNGDPISITVKAGKALRVDHTLTVEVPTDGNAVTLDIDQVDIGGTTTGTDQFTGRVGYFARSGDIDEFFDRFAQWHGNMVQMGADESARSFPITSNLDAGDSVSGSISALASGRRMEATFSPSDGNGTWYGYAWLSAYGVALILDSGQDFEKLDTHELTVGFEVTLARA